MKFLGFLKRLVVGVQRHLRLHSFLPPCDSSSYWYLGHRYLSYSCWSRWRLDWYSSNHLRTQGRWYGRQCCYQAWWYGDLWLTHDVGQNPIVASARRLKDSVLVLQPPENTASSPMVWRTLDDIKDYHQVCLRLLPLMLVASGSWCSLQVRCHCSWSCQHEQWCWTLQAVGFQRRWWYWSSYELQSSSGYVCPLVLVNLKVLVWVHPPSWLVPC